MFGCGNLQVGHVAGLYGQCDKCKLFFLNELHILLDVLYIQQKKTLQAWHKSLPVGSFSSCLVCCYFYETYEYWYWPVTTVKFSFYPGSFVIHFSSLVPCRAFSVWLVNMC
jgi:hypothetical protein